MKKLLSIVVSLVALTIVGCSTPVTIKPILAQSLKNGWQVNLYEGTMAPPTNPTGWMEGKRASFPLGNDQIEINGPDWYVVVNKPRKLLSATSKATNNPWVLEEPRGTFTVSWTKDIGDVTLYIRERGESISIIQFP